MQKYLRELTNTFLHIYKSSKENVFFNFLLRIASFFYFLVYKLRIFLYKFNVLKTEKLEAVVISIGNITTGGTGKTPLVIEIAKHLLNEGYKIAVISRGYKRKITSTNEQATVLVSDSQEIFTNYELSGDEPFLIAKKVPKAIVLVNNKKIAACKAALKLGAEILILDDGYQYIKLKRDENILLLDTESPFDNGHLLPRGKLRELPSEINRASAIVLLNSDKATQEKYLDELKTIKKFAKEIPVFSMNYKIKNFHGLNIKTLVSPNEFTKFKVIAFSGIANSDSFLKSLREINIHPIDYVIYPDHHQYTYDDIKHLVNISKNHNVENIVTTEKDGVKVEELCEASEATFWMSELEINFNSLNFFDELLLNKKKWVKTLIKPKH